jgi:hypothetical protein
MIVFNIFSGTVGGMTALIVEQEKNLTQELYVSPISRYTIILGKMIGSEEVSSTLPDFLFHAHKILESQTMVNLRAS